MLFGRRRFIHTFTCQLLFLLEEGVPFLKAMELIAMQQKRWHWIDIILDIRARVRDGESLSQALSHHKVLDTGYRETIAWADGSSARLLIALRLLSSDFAQRKNPLLLQTFAPRYGNRYSNLADCLTENKSVSTRS